MRVRYRRTPRGQRAARRILALLGGMALLATGCGNGMDAEPATRDGRTLVLDSTPPPCVLVSEWETGFGGRQHVRYRMTYCLVDVVDPEHVDEAEVGR